MFPSGDEKKKRTGMKSDATMVFAGGNNTENDMKSWKNESERGKSHATPAAHHHQHQSNTISLVPYDQFCVR